MKRYVLAMAGLLLLGAGVYGYHWIHSEASSSVSVRPLQPVSDVLGSETSLKPWQTASFTTQLPTWLRQVSATDSPSDPAAHSYVVNGGRDKDAQIAVTIASLGNNSLNEIPAVRVRANHADEYQPTAIAAAPDGAVAYQHVGSFETAVFWQYQGRYIAVVASGSTSQQSDIQTALASVLTDWQWAE
jgi:hypothetical protein